MAESEQVKFSIRGPGVDDAFRLDIFADIISSYQQILDKTYLAVVNKKRLTHEDRELFNVQVTKWQRGSLLMDLAVTAVPLVQGYLEFSAGQGRFMSLSEVMELVYKFLKARLEGFSESGKYPQVNVINSPNSPVYLNIGNGEIQVSNNIYNAAFKTEPHFKKLTSKIDGQQIKEVGSLSQDNRGVLLTSADNALFNPKTEMADNSEEIVAKIFRFDVETRSGRLRILEGHEIEKGRELRFQVIGEQSLDQFVDALHSNIPHSKLRGLRELVKHPSGVTTIAAFHVQKLLSSE